jgi:hypothetical protein
MWEMFPSSQAITAFPKPRVHAHLSGTLALCTSALTPAAMPHVESLRNVLTLMQRTGDGAQAAAFFEDVGPWMHIPRGFKMSPEGMLLDPLHLDVIDGRSGGYSLPPGTRATVTFGMPPFPADQPKFIDDMVRGSMANGHGGLCLAPTRSGKTLCALEAACRLGGTTLILLDRTELLKQWKRDIEGKLRDARGKPVHCGIVQGDSFEHGPDVHFAVATVQTIARRQLPESFRRAWRTVIVDECQGAPTDMLWGALRRIYSAFVLGMTATPRRKDGLAPAIQWVIGPVIARLDRKLEADVWWAWHEYRAAKIEREVEQPSLDDNAVTMYSTKLVKPRLRTVRGFNRIHAEKSLYMDEQRVHAVASSIADGAQHRQTLVMVIETEHARRLHNALMALRPRVPDIGLFIGTADTSEMQNRIVLATDSKAGKGVDFQPPPTCLHLASPFGDAEQIMGRALQPQVPFKSLIVDHVDGHPEFLRVASHRAGTYRAKGFNILNRFPTEQGP